MKALWGAAAALALAITPGSAMAGWKIMAPGTAVAVAKSSMTVTPGNEWNKWSARPSKKGEIWTMDGMSLNELSFFAGIVSGETILKDRKKKDRPLPKFDSKMLLPDVVQLYEGTMRIALDTSAFTVDTVEPVKFAGHDGVAFTYHYTVEQDNLVRKGEGRAAVIGGKLYMANFIAPSIHYFDRDIAQVRTLMDSIKI